MWWAILSPPRSSSMPHVEVFDVAEAGHMVAGDSNELFNGAMLEFLERRFAPGGR
jgi:pimeloyl-ACP methyl ester carboxylesterase